MKIKEIRGLTGKELDDKLTELRKELLKINGQVAVGTTPKNPGQVKAIKRSIARILYTQAQGTAGQAQSPSGKKAEEKDAAASPKPAKKVAKKEGQETEGSTKA